MTSSKPCWRYPGLLPVLLLLSACASTIPPAIKSGPEQDIQVEAVQASPARFVNAPVRWGGEIISVQNKVRETLIELLSRPLDGDGRPRQDVAGGGRFLARVSGFLDPGIYEAGRELTVTGRVESLVVRPVGEFPYRFPQVVVRNYYLWPLRREIPYPWGHPFYDPWYPYYRSPFYRDPYSGW